MSRNINSQDRSEQTSGNRRRSFFLKLAALGGVLLPLKAVPADTKNDGQDRIDALQREIASLKHNVGRLEDLNEIRKLQHTYGYYLDKCLYEEVAQLFADDSQVRFMGGISARPSAASGCHRRFSGPIERQSTLSIIDAGGCAC
jgi:hypothetical protein